MQNVSSSPCNSAHTVTQHYPSTHPITQHNTLPPKGGSRPGCSRVAADVSGEVQQSFRRVTGEV